MREKVDTEDCRQGAGLFFFQNNVFGNKNKAWLGKPYLFESLEKIIGEQVRVWSQQTLGMPKFVIVRPIGPIDDREKISAREQKSFCSRIGMLLYLDKYSRQNIASPCRFFNVAFACGFLLVVGVFHVDILI